jgi:uncharacterized membrane protein YGL010W
MARQEKQTMLAGRPMSEWIEEYSQGHQNRVNQLCHKFGIPLIALSLMLLPFVLLKSDLWKVSAAMFIFGWILQFVGHAFEKKPPEFFKDWRFLFVGTRWWLAKMRGH